MLQNLITMSKPYTDIEVTDKYIIREFNENIDPIELMWHRDDESRTT
jgi:calcineurin-like phosphoesterase family protein